MLQLNYAKPMCVMKADQHSQPIAMCIMHVDDFLFTYSTEYDFQEVIDMLCIVCGLRGVTCTR